MKCQRCGAEGATNLSIQAGIVCDRCDKTLEKVCDFCTDPGPKWVFPCKAFSVRFGMGEDGVNFARGWASCDVCRDLILAKDTAGLTDRATKSFIASHPDSHREIIRKAFSDMYREFFRNRNGSPVSIELANAIHADRAILRPRGHADYMRALETRLRWLRWAQNSNSKLWHTYRRQYVGGYLATLETGPTFYMDDHFCALVDSARRDMPDDTTFDTRWLISDHGWLWIENQFQVPDVIRREDIPVTRDFDVRIGAIGWYPVQDGRYWFAFFLDMERLIPGDREEGFGLWSHLALRDGDVLKQRISSFEDYVNNDPVAKPAPYKADPNRQNEKLHELRWLYTALFLMSQRLTARVRHQTDRRTRRRIEREKQIPPSFVEVVTLRRKEADRQKETQGREVDWQWQWTVRGHWRKQWFPSEGIHKPTFIESYVKGPEGRPLKPSTAKIFAATR